MIHLTAQTQILLAIKPVDFRKRIDGLSAVCKYQLQQNPTSGKLFVFVNRSKTMVRILVYEDKGFWLMTRRFSKGKFNWPSSEGNISPIHARNLRKLLSCQ